MLTADLVANLLISRFYLTVLQDMGGTATFALFLGLAAFSFLFIFAMAPETKGRPLEAIRVYWENGGRWPDAPARAPRRGPRPGSSPRIAADRCRLMTGTRMAAEMAEQPARLASLVVRAGEVARLVGGRRFDGVTIVARGSPDHAATYGRYLLEAATGRPVSMAAPSLHTLYGIEADYRGQLVVAVSQSGRTPEIVRTLEALSGAGGFGLAITNDEASELAARAEAVVALRLGEEEAVPATKTVTGQMVAFVLLAGALGNLPFPSAALTALPSAVDEVLADGGCADDAVAALDDAAQLIVVARGYLYGAALETALKIKETCSLLADGYSSADLRHGPIAAVTHGPPVIDLNADGPAHADVSELTSELRRRGAQVVTVGAGGDVSLPAEVPEALAPGLAVVRGQQLARALALRLGYDPDRPEGLTKVTPT